MSTIECQHKSFIDKFDAIDIFIKKLSAVSGLSLQNNDNPFDESIQYKITTTKPFYGVHADILSIRDMLSALRDDYTISTMNYVNDSSNNLNIYNEAIDIFNIESRINEIINNCAKAHQKTKLFLESTNDDISTLPMLNMLKQHQTENVTKTIDYESCCGQKMIVYADQSILYCEICQKEFEIKGMVFNDIQFLAQDVKKSKHCKYDRQRNFLTWKQHIWATDSFNLDDKAYQQIRKDLIYFINRDNYGTYGKTIGLTICNIREFLEEFHHTKYNRNGASILAQASGVTPPMFTDIEHSALDSIYSRILRILNSAKDPDCKDPDLASRENTPYCPYFISKIVEAKWPDDLDKQRIQCYIFHKKPDTVKKLDKHWSLMCPLLGFKFIPTQLTKLPECPNLAYQRVMKHKQSNVSNYINYYAS